MKKATVAAIAAAMLSLSALPAAAQPDSRWHGGPDNPDWDASANYRDHDDGDHADRDHQEREERRMTRDDYVYRGHDGRYYCRRGDGATGLVVGGLGGAAIGSAIGGSSLAALLGAAGGAALGSSIERGQIHCR